MRVVIGLGLLLMACGGKSASEGDARGGASSLAGASSTAGAAGSFGGSESDAGGAGEAGSAGAIDENDPKGTLVFARQIDWLLGDEDRLYWLADPNIFQGCSKADCANTVVDYPNNIFIPSIGNTTLIWERPINGTTSPFPIVSCQKTGCVAGEPVVVAQPDSNQFRTAVAADGEYVYWRDAATIRRCTEQQCGATNQVVVAALTEPNSVDELLLQGEHVYWKTGNAIWRARKDGSSEPELVANIGTADFWRAAVGPDQVYWVDPESQAILSCPLTGCGSSAPKVAVSTTSTKGIVHADDSGLYWNDGLERDIHYCPLDGCTTSTPLTEGGTSGPFLVDARYLYWVPRAFPVDDIIYAQNIVRRLKPESGR